MKLVRKRRISSDTPHVSNLKRNNTDELICKTETVDPRWLSQPQRLKICFENLVRRRSLKMGAVSPQVVGAPINAFNSDQRPAGKQLEKILLCLSGAGISIEINWLLPFAFMLPSLAVSVALTEKKINKHEMG